MFGTALRLAILRYSGLRCLAREFIKGDALPDNPKNRQTEPFGIIERAVIIPVRLLIQIPEQMEWFDAHIGPRNSALSQRLKFHRPRFAGELRAGFHAQRQPDSLI
jgi:hypothetical protein